MSTDKKTEEQSNFSDLPLSPEILKVVADLGYKSMTQIQAQSIPALLEGRDVIGQSKTGSGKTAAFTIPILQNIPLVNGRTQRSQPLALILCPTRELCAQVAREIRKLGRMHNGLQVGALSGGQPLGPQIASIERGLHIVVGTPGRILDHLSRQTLDLSTVKTIVLDEADRMLDMGFEEDMEQILSALPEQRQMVLFSATFPKTIESISKRHQTDAVRVTIESAPEASTIQQCFVTVPSSFEIYEEKVGALLRLFTLYPPEAVIVFCNLKITTDDLQRDLVQMGISSEALHGDLEQSDRDRIMAKFRNRSVRVLVATDVAARGLDVTDMDMVINFDLPSKPEVYVHRVGRTGRAGKNGMAISLISEKETSKIRHVEKLTNVPLEEITDLPDYGTFDLPAKMATIFISGGRKNKMRPGDILGALTGEAGGLDASQIGKIEIHDFFSYVAVSADIAEKALDSLLNGRIKGKRFRVEPVR